MGKIITIIAVIIVVAVGAYLFLSRPATPAPPTLPPPPSQEPPPAVEPEANPAPSGTPTPAPKPAPPPPPAGGPPPPAHLDKTINMTANGFSPATLTISVGTTVKFVNTDTVAHWPASGVHPTHQICPGFDALQPIQPGASYSLSFSVAKTCPMHDHLNPGTTGTIVVQ